MNSNTRDYAGRALYARIIFILQVCNKIYKLEKLCPQESLTWILYTVIKRREFNITLLQYAPI